MTLRMNEEEYRDFMAGRKLRGLPCVGNQAVGISLADMAEKPKRSKYGNRRVEIDGMKFDSQKEADFYFGKLLPEWKSGAYKLLARQVPFDLPGGIRYIADFVTVSVGGQVCVMDAKSPITRKNRTYINKKKQMRACWGIEIIEI